MIREKQSGKWSILGSILFVRLGVNLGVFWGVFYLSGLV
jgi:hypothetical protein